jgi:predicted aminopeptidase
LPGKYREIFPARNANRLGRALLDCLPDNLQFAVKRAKPVKKIFWTVMVALGLLAVLNHELLDYGLSQAIGQLRIVIRARPVGEFLEDPAFDPGLKKKLQLVEELRRYAFDSLGMVQSQNYTTLYVQPGEAILWVVTACQPFALQPREWSFPFLGSFSYKGFFNYRKAERLEQELMQEGWDTNIRTAGGWSTLGWFRDPVLSGMLEEDAGDLAETILHELTHGTLFVRDSLRFNENLATFIGTKGALGFLEMKYGAESEEFNSYRANMHDRKAFSAHILRGSQYLDSLYTSMKDDMPVYEKTRLKQQAIDRIVQAVDTLQLFRADAYRDHLRRRKPNNTYFMSYLRYRGDLERLEHEYVCKYDSDIRRMLQDYRRRYPTL